MAPRQTPTQCSAGLQHGEYACGAHCHDVLQGSSPAPPLGTFHCPICTATNCNKRQVFTFGLLSRLKSHMTGSHMWADTHPLATTETAMRRRNKPILMDEYQRDSGVYNALIRRVAVAWEKLQQFIAWGCDIHPHNLNMVPWPTGEQAIYTRAGGKAKEHVANLLVEMRKSMQVAGVRQNGNPGTYAEIAVDLESTYNDWKEILRDEQLPDAEQ